MGWENLRFLTEMLFILEPVRDRRRRRRRRRFRIDTEYEIGTIIVDHQQEVIGSQSIRVSSNTLSEVGHEGSNFLVDLR